MSRPAKKNKSRAAAVADSPQMGLTIQRLRKAYKLSLGELSEQSGVAKSVISQIEKNETNPTLSTIWRLSQALDASMDEVLQSGAQEKFLEHVGPPGTPLLTSEDGLCRLRIIGWLKTVDWVQWYDFVAEPGGVLESEPHQKGSVENLTVLGGALEVTVDDRVHNVAAGETLRYRGDFRHTIRNPGDTTAHATMVNILKTTVMD